MPGANLVNLAVYIGGRLRGLPGALVALLGVTVPPFIIVLLVGWWYFSPYNLPVFHNALAGCAAGAIGLTAANALELTRPFLRQPVALVLVALTAVAVGYFHLNLVPALLVFGGLGVAKMLVARSKEKAA